LLVKVAQVIKTAIVADIHHIQIRIEQKFAGVINFDLIQILEYGQTGIGFEKPAGRSRRHMYDFRYILQVDFFPVVEHEIFMDPLDPVAGCLKLGAHIAFAGKEAEGLAFANDVHDFIKVHQPFYS
jgi:hypothetical protein